MNTIKIFLASSAELKEDRTAFQVFIGQENKIYKHNGINLEVELWEDFIDAMSATRLQDEYNKAIVGCDIFIMLFATKVGKYTAEEFEKAFKQFQETSKPLIYTYFKNTSKELGSIDKSDMKSLWAFQEKLLELGHFQTEYKSTEALHLHFKQQLDKLFADGYFKFSIIEPSTIPKFLSSGQPSVPLSFIGRDIELADIKQKLEKNKLLLIHAEGGMGKTTLAAKYLNDNINQYKHIAWLFCDNGINEQIKTLALMLKVDLNLYKEDDEQLLALKTAMQNLGDDCLLVLDNANTPKHIDEFQNKFGGLPWHILLTSRCQQVLPKENELDLHHLEAEQAKELFKKNQDEKTPEFEELLNKFLKAIGYNTLMIELFSKNLHELSALGETLADAVQQFEEKGLFLGERSFEIKADWTKNTHKQAATTDQIIEALYDLTTLEEVERFILVNLSLLPAENYLVTLLVDVILSSKDKEALDTKIYFTKLLKTLAQKGWLASDTLSYRMNPVVQQIILAKNEKTVWDDAETMVSNLNYKLKTNGFFLINLTSYAQAQPFVELAESITRFEYVERFDIGVLLLDLSDYYRAIGNTTASLKHIEIASNIFKKVNKENYGVCLQRLGMLYENQGNLEKALEFFEQDFEISKQLLEQNPHSESTKDSLAICYHRLGMNLEKQGNLEKALEFFEQDVKLRKELFENNPQSETIKNNLAISYNRLGINYEIQGNLEKALEFFEQDIEISKELFEKSPQSEPIKDGLARSYAWLGYIYEKQGNLEKALEFFEQDIKLRKELFENNPQSVDVYHKLAVSNLLIGNIHFKMQKQKEGEAYLKIAEKIWTELIGKAPLVVEYQNRLEWVQKKLESL